MKRAGASGDEVSGGHRLSGGRGGEAAGERRPTGGRGIFSKVFIYTTLLAVVLALVAAAIFSVQILSYYRIQSQRALALSYQGLAWDASNGGDLQALAEAFHESNQSLQFCLKDLDDNIIYATPELDLSTTAIAPIGMLDIEDCVLYVAEAELFDAGGLLRRVLVTLLITLVLCVVGAFILARQMTRPIKALADDASRMQRLEDVPPPPARSDELGLLANDVHVLYRKLRESITQLEREIARTRAMEEAQRAFFAAASHELKTPIAATSVIVEGMLANVGDFQNHPKYLRECLHLMDAQANLVAELLEVVKLSDGSDTPVFEVVNLSETVAEVLTALRTLADAKRLKLTVAIAGDQLCRADKHMLSRSLSNIIANAIQNTDEDGEVTIAAVDTSAVCRLSVLNRPAHIAEDVLPKLFDPFYRIDTARSHTTDGRSGLGLTIVQKNLEATGVAFGLENADGGVRFWLDLPSPYRKSPV